MKKILFTALALPLAFAACSNDDFEVNQASSEKQNGELIELSENFALGFSKEAAGTRAEYDVTTGKLLFEWMPKINDDDDDDDVTPDRIGLCWTGQVPDGKAYTNYEFEHFAYAKQDAVANLDPCNNGGWRNLVFLSENLKDALGSSANDAGNSYVSGWDPFTVNGGATAIKGSGYFRTTSKTIFGGEYLVYTPFNEKFIDTDNLVATSGTSFNVNVGDEKKSQYKGVANEMFCLGTANVKGGTSANGFVLSPLSGMIRVRLSKAAGATSKWTEIEKVAIYSTEDGGIITKQAIDGTKVASAQAAGDIANCLIANDVRERSTSLFATVAEPFEITELKKGSEQDIIIPALPQTIKNASVILFDEDGESALVKVGDIDVKSNDFATINLELTDANALQSDVFYVVDMETFGKAMTSSFGKKDSEKLNVTVNLLKDITFGDGGSFGVTENTVYVNKNMTIKGGKIIVPNDETLNVAIWDNKKLTIESDVEVQGKNCCGNKVGALTISGKDGKNTSEFVFNGNIDNYGSFKIGDTSKQTAATFNGYVKNLNGSANLQNNNGTESITVFNKTTAVFNGDVLNEGSFATIRNNAALGSYTTINNLTNDGSLKIGKLTTLTVTSGSSLVNNGIIEIESNKGTTTALDGTLVNNGNMSNNGSVNIMGVLNNYGTLSNVKQGSAIYDYVGCQYGGKKADVPYGTEYICDVDNSKREEGNRLQYALGSNMATTTVRFIKGSDEAEYEYDLKDYMSYTKLGTVKYIVELEGETLKVNNTNSNEITFGTGLTVNKAKSVEFENGKVKIDGEVIVNNGSISNGDKSTVTVAENVTLNENAGTMTVTGKKDVASANEKTAADWIINGSLVVDNVLTGNDAGLKIESGASFDLNGNLTIGEQSKASFGYSSYTDVSDIIYINGSFERILSSGTATANPAKVLCEDFVRSNGAVVVNGAPETKK